MHDANVLCYQTQYSRGVWNVDSDLQVECGLQEFQDLQTGKSQSTVDGKVEQARARTVDPHVQSASETTCEQICHTGSVLLGRGLQTKR